MEIRGQRWPLANHRSQAVSTHTFNPNMGGGSRKIGSSRPFWVMGDWTSLKEKARQLWLTPLIPALGISCLWSQNLGDTCFRSKHYRGGGKNIRGIETESSPFSLRIHGGKISPFSLRIHRDRIASVWTENFVEERSGWLFCSSDLSAFTLHIWSGFLLLRLIRVTLQASLCLNWGLCKMRVR